VIKSLRPGTDTSEVEVGNIDRFGVWVLVQDTEYFLPYEEFPWFREASVGDILQVELLHGDHLRWPTLDVDLCIESLKSPASFPLIYR
jgi:hypothetical protein